MLYLTKLRSSLATLLCLFMLFLVGLTLAANEEHDRTQSSSRRKLQSKASREEKMSWFKLADADKQSWPELFSVDQHTKKEMINGAVAENPWGTLCTSIDECS